MSSPQSEPASLPKTPAMLCAGLFAGAALYISFVEHPTRMLCGTPEFDRDCRYGAKEYVHLMAKRVSRNCGGFAGAMLANCVPTL